MALTAPSRSKMYYLSLSPAASSNDRVQTEKRDALRATEKKYQKLWQDEKVFESDAPSCSEHPPDSISPEELRAKFPKFFGKGSN
jgi:hypothetical protein